MNRSAAALMVVLAAFTLTISPESNDFGKVTVRSRVRQVFTVSGVIDRTTATLTGPNAADFVIQTNQLDATCVDDANSPVCRVDVDFAPRSLGPKAATLVVTSARAGRITAQLRGIGVNPICENKVVFCNYAFLYSGNFDWNTTLRGDGSSTVTDVKVNIINGRAGCVGTQTISDSGGPHVWSVNGTGLVAVEFKLDENRRRVYKISVACPQPYNSSTPQSPAELGLFGQETDDQVYVVTGNSVVPDFDLRGTRSFPAPEADPENGVTGTTTLTWTLRR